MKTIPRKVINLLDRANFVIVASIDNKGFPHTSCKGMVDIDKKGKIYIFDLYKGNTYKNIKKVPLVSITVVDENIFAGYCIKGEAEIVSLSADKGYLYRRWKEKLNRRITERVISHIRKNISTSHHPEADFPEVENIIVVNVHSILDLANGQYL